MGLLSGLLSGAIRGLIASGVQSVKEEMIEANEDKIRVAAEEAGLAADEYVLSKIQPSIASRCRQSLHDPAKLREVLTHYTDKNLMSVAEARVVWEAHKNDAINAAMERVELYFQTPKDAYRLAEVLGELIPRYILDHCDSVMENEILLNTYILQCVNNEKISVENANLLRECYIKARELSNFK